LDGCVAARCGRADAAQVGVNVRDDARLVVLEDCGRGKGVAVVSSDCKKVSAMPNSLDPIP
jgi:hypothetical protein